MLSIMFMLFLKLCGVVVLLFQFFFFYEGDEDRMYFFRGWLGDWSEMIYSENVWYIVKFQ